MATAAQRQHERAESAGLNFAYHCVDDSVWSMLGSQRALDIRESAAFFINPWPLAIRRISVTPEQEAEAIRLCQQIIDGFNRISEIVDIFLTTATPYLPSPPLAPH
jgi:hypothetical protein